MTPDASYPDGEKQAQYYGEVLRRVGALPGVEAVASTTDLPLSGTDSYLGFQIEGRAEPTSSDSTDGGYHQVSPGYFAALGIPILRGRALHESDGPGSPDVAVISRTMAERYWPGEDPLGRRISYGTDDGGQPAWTTIVGVVGDVKQKGLHADPRPEAYVPLAQSPARYMTLVVRSPLEPGVLADAVRKELLALDPNVPAYGIKTLREVLDGSLAARRFNMALLLVFAAVAVALASIGLYGVIAYMVTQRTHEIGVRLALGARPADVLRLVVRHGMALALAGVAFGVLGALAMIRALASLLVGVAATDPWTYSSVGLLLSTVAFLACLVPALRAARVEPMTALRSE
jgi:putative ABC transport system permease protein